MIALPTGSAPIPAGWEWRNVQVLFISLEAVRLNQEKKCAVKASLSFIHYLGS